VRCWHRRRHRRCRDPRCTTIFTSRSNANAAFTFTACISSRKSRAKKSKKGRSSEKSCSESGSVSFGKQREQEERDGAVVQDGARRGEEWRSQGEREVLRREEA
jgi:hypothetical protein